MSLISSTITNRYCNSMALYLFCSICYWLDSNFQSLDGTRWCIYIYMYCQIQLWVVYIYIYSKNQQQILIFILKIRCWWYYIFRKCVVDINRYFENDERHRTIYSENQGCHLRREQSNIILAHGLLVRWEQPPPVSMCWDLKVGVCVCVPRDVSFVAQ